MILEELSSQNFMNIIGKNIRKRRTEKNLSLEELGKKIGVSRITLTKIEHGDANTSLNIMWKICNELSIEFNDLFKDEEKILLSKASKNKETNLKDKSFTIELMFREDGKNPTEFFRIYLSKSKSILTETHIKKSVEIVTIMKGKVMIKVENEEFILEEYDSLKFSADKTHEYRNISDEEAIVHSTVIYK
ncbi:XRE family transcriptional regulator [Clostridium sp.]|uniref:helix-turn-helix domain-containing protein n=1 Tax=Clostridium sp. TaxID=1506 RepID=UPI002622406D|nr:XRE family transcriptional regulator [Clostridium sp.]